MSYDGVLQPWYPAHKHPYLILQATKRMPVARVQWPSTAVSKLTDLAHSGQFKGKTWSWFKVYSIQIPYHRLPFWYNFEYSLLKTIGLFQFDFHHSFWSICIRIPWRIWADLCMIFYLPLSTEMRSICIHVMNDFSFLWCLCRACIFASRVTFFGGFSDFKLRG